MRGAEPESEKETEGEDRRWGRRRRWFFWVFCFTQLVCQQEALD